MYKTSGRMLKWIGPVAEFTLGQVDRTNGHSSFVPIDNGPQDDAISPGYVAQKYRLMCVNGGLARAGTRIMGRTKFMLIRNRMLMAASAVTTMLALAPAQAQ